MDSVFHHAGVEPFADQAQHHTIAHPSLEELPQVAMVDLVERLSNMMPPSRTHPSSIPK